MVNAKKRGKQMTKTHDGIRDVVLQAISDHSPDLPPEPDEYVKRIRNVIADELEKEKCSYRGDRGLLWNDAIEQAIRAVKGE